MNARWALSVVLVISVLHYSVMGWYGEEPSPASEIIMAYSLYFMFAWWAVEDARYNNFHRPIDFGAFIFFAWPIILPAYLVKTRGLKGVVIFASFIILYLLPWLTGWLAYYANPANQ